MNDYVTDWLSAGNGDRLCAAQSEIFADWATS
jgi:hypothetical protein